MMPLKAIQRKKGERVLEERRKNRDDKLREGGSIKGRE
jgi:hypothetical protein